MRVGLPRLIRDREQCTCAGPSVVVRTKSAPANADPMFKDEKVAGELGVVAAEKFAAEALKAADRDLDDAARPVKERPEFRARVDHLRMYTSRGPT